MTVPAWRAIAPLVIAVCLATLGATGCNSSSSGLSQSRPPIERVVTASISQAQVHFSPQRIGGGPTSVVIANLTDVDVTVTLESESIIAPSARIVADGTATIRKTLEPGVYTATAKTDTALIGTGTLSVGPTRRNSNRTLLLP